MTEDNSTSIYFDRKCLQFVGLNEAVMNKLRVDYPTVNIEAELKKMSLWLTTPKGKGRKGTISFIINWLERVPVKPQDQVQHSTVNPAMQCYLKDLWKDREYLLEINTIRN